MYVVLKIHMINGIVVLVLLKDGTTILIDFGPEFRLQAIRAHIKHIDYVLNTHAHADHISGIDDLFQFARIKTDPLIIYTNKNAESEIKSRFSFFFPPPDSPSYEKSKLRIEIPNDNFYLGKIQVKVIKIKHGILNISGYRIGNFTYITDASEIPEESFEIIKGTEILVINGLQVEYHPTHFSFSETLSQIERIQPREAYIIHISHGYQKKLTHEELRQYIAEQQASRPLLQNIKIEPAYDTLVLSNLIV